MELPYQLWTANSRHCMSKQWLFGVVYAAESNPNTTFTLQFTNVSASHCPLAFAFHLNESVSSFKPSSSTWTSQHLTVCLQPKKGSFWLFLTDSILLGFPIFTFVLRIFFCTSRIVIISVSCNICVCQFQMWEIGSWGRQPLIVIALQTRHYFYISLYVR